MEQPHLHTTALWFRTCHGLMMCALKSYAKAAHILREGAEG